MMQELSIKDIALRNRSYRRFYQDKKLTEEQLCELVEIGHLTPSGANKQPLRFKVICDEEKNIQVFECLRWAGFYKDWDGPVEGERPTGYIILAADENEKCTWDEGIAGQTILLAATQRGMGGCFIGNIDREKLCHVIDLPQNMTIRLVLALGYPKEAVVIDRITKGQDMKYYRDENQVQHVPKLKLSDILL